MRILHWIMKGELSIASTEVYVMRVITCTPNSAKRVIQTNEALKINESVQKDVTDTIQDDSSIVVIVKNQ